MDAESSERHVRHYLDAIGRGDHAVAMECFNEDATWTTPPSMPWASVFHGRQAIFDEYFAVDKGLFTTGMDSYDLETRLVVAQGEQFRELLAGTASLTVTDAIEAELIGARHAGALCRGASRLTSDSKGLLLPRPDDVAWTAYVDRFVEERLASGEEAAALEQWQGNESEAVASACAAAAARASVGVL